MGSFSCPVHLPWLEKVKAGNRGKSVHAWVCLLLNASVPGKGAWLAHQRHGGGTLCSNGPRTQKVPEDVLDLVAWGHWVRQEKDAGVNPALWSQTF